MEPEKAPSDEAAFAPSGWALAHARELGASKSVPAGRVEVELLTDPYSVWCWGFEPVRRALEWRYPSVAFATKVGGMFARLPDPSEIGFDVQRFFGVVQRTTGMPMRLDAATRDRPVSTYPACIHVGAVRLLRPDLETRYLRALREAVYLDARNISKPDVAADVAQDVGVDRDEFLEALASGEPERDFRQALAGLEAQGLHAYPTLLVRVGSRVAKIEGFQSLPGLLAIVEGSSGRLHPPRAPPEPLDVVAAGERVATREVAEVIGVGVEETYARLAALEAEGRLTHEELATGFVWRRT